MNITIKSGEELNKLLDALATDIVDANIYFKLFTGLISSFPEYSDERNQSNTFWSLTLQAVKEAYLIRLCRIFDQNNKSLNLVNLLDTIKTNRHFFEEPHFKERLKDNAFVESLAEGVIIPSIEELQADIEFASNDNPVVYKLSLWRGNVYAHTSAKTALGKFINTLEENSISEAEIKQLLDQSFSISNKYMSLYVASTWSRQIIGHDDYLSLFKFLRMGLEKFEADIQRDIDSCGINK
jgi:hypothetical protein